MGAPLKKFCACCKRPFTEEEYAEKLRRKRQNALNSRAKAAANGKRLGRKSRVDHVKIYHFWLNGRRASHLAKEFGVSISTIHRALDRRRQEER